LGFCIKSEHSGETLIGKHFFLISNTGFTECLLLTAQDGSHRSKKRDRYQKWSLKDVFIAIFRRTLALANCKSV